MRPWATSSSSWGALVTATVPGTNRPSAAEPIPQGRVEGPVRDPRAVTSQA